MLSRRSLIAAALLGSLAAAPALASGPQAYNAKAFAEAQKSGKPILIAVHASWCPTCHAQSPILNDLSNAPKFKNLIYFIVDYDRQKDVVRQLGVRTQSTLIVFKGDREQARSAGDTNKASIAALLDKTL
jgi:thioredoxin-like negative regulator of GroEL